MKAQVLKIGVMVLALGLAAVACDIACGAEPPAAPVELVKTEVYFGRDLPGGHKISRRAWADFMDKVITRHFPKGFTVYEAYGQMQHTNGLIEKQSTWVVAVVHPKDPAIDRVVREIIDAFRAQFSMAQVVHVSAPLISARFYAD